MIMYIPAPRISTHLLVCILLLVLDTSATPIFPPRRSTPWTRALIPLNDYAFKDNVTTHVCTQQNNNTCTVTIGVFDTRRDYTTQIFLFDSNCIVIGSSSIMSFFDPLEHKFAITSQLPAVLDVVQHSAAWPEEAKKVNVTLAYKGYPVLRPTFVPVGPNDSGSERWFEQDGGLCGGGGWGVHGFTATFRCTD